MGNDKNRLNQYGDSLIAAVANMCGMDLITLNGKDFIFDERAEDGNENIRNYLRKINKETSYATNAEPISLFEHVNKLREKEIQANKDAYKLKDLRVYKFVSGREFE